VGEVLYHQPLFRLHFGRHYRHLPLSFTGDIGGFLFDRFAEAFRPLFPFLADLTGYIPDARVISIPAALILTFILVRKGASIGVNACWQLY
jgi:hypothetical protein